VIFSEDIDMTDRFAGREPGASGPATHGFAIVPSDGVDLPEVTRALYVGTAGALRLTLQSGAIISLAGVPGGSMLPLRVSRLHATGTTAADLAGFV
jgi:hypothetical protein